MFKIKSTLAAFLGAAITLTSVGCGSSDSSSSGSSGSAASGADSKGLKIVCTIFPEYDWVREILGDKASSAELTYLLDSGVDLHSYQPTAEDILNISSCDMFVYVGGESDEWVEDALSQAANKDMKVINLMEVMGDKAKVEELKEGMQEGEHEHEHEEGEEEHDEEHEEEEHDEEHDDEEHDEEEHEHEHEEGEEEYDEHVWLSVHNAKILCAEIEKNLEALDPGSKDSYKANLDAYAAKLDTLDNDFKTLFESADNPTLIVGDRFPFRYFVDDYGVDYYAAFVGCSAETEASFETITFLAEKLNETGNDTVYTIENSDGKIADSIINSSKDKNQSVAKLNSVQSVSKEEIENGTTYLGLMQENYETLKADLG